MRALRSAIAPILLLCSILACNFSPSTTSPGESSVEFPSTLEPTISPATDTPLPPTATIVPPTQTPVPTNAPTAEPSPTLPPTPIVLFRDDFDGALQPGWTWVRENKERWSLTANQGYLRLTLNPGNCGGVPRNVPLQPIPEGDYEIATLVEFTPIGNFQLAGLIVYQDENSNIKFGRAFCNAGEACVGNGVYFDNVIKGVFTGSNYATSTVNPSRLHLRLLREGAIYSGLFSEDGKNWIKIGEHTSELKPVGVGLYGGQSCEGSVPADFDYFTITKLP